MIDTLGDILRNNALKFPDEIAFVYEGSRVTYIPQPERAPIACLRSLEDWDHATGSGFDPLAEYA